MENKQKIAGPIIRSSFTIMILAGLIYPIATTGMAQAIMPDQADGSLIYNEQNEVVGSELIGQNFTDPKYFHGRVSAIEYNGAGSGSNNYAPSNGDLLQRVEESIEAWKTANPDTPISEVPVDLVTDSGSGLDPHISVEGALAQVNRIMDETGLSKDQLTKLIKENTQGKELGLFGEERVNVLMLNLDLEKLLQ
ncbi:potassium-transporting ATPase, C subunit [Bacillus sp. NRRL B-14911]|uniref:Potassium-transporting ATPase KdpC subunit n=1 Tax=Bacillus infantis NRRL B-14911 TaxID=1367477 RepID=U5LGC9_9BACI|nr:MULTISPECIES: potassium-transporting ATPase subunit KdpC [Bacillus]AGX06914.1 potassium transporter KtrA [Bacillus infantis NRRL B-14911]EAR67832.1 potassium-transporting ATPase, C subunit [Bacillus sp. NRRL B-14911]